MTLGRILALGGWPMVPIYLCSVVALAVFLRKVFELRRAQQSSLEWLPRAIEELEAGDLASAASTCARAEHPAARSVEAAIRVARQRPDRAEAEAVRVGSLEIQRLDKHLGLLAFIAQVAPLLGLLGTVIGMVRLFFDLEGSSATVDTAQLSSGIWQALLTTAAGLTVAVPTLAAHSYLASRSDSMRLVLHDAVEQALTALPAPQAPAEPVVAREVAGAV